MVCNRGPAFKVNMYDTDKFESKLIDEYLRILPQKAYKMLEVGYLNGGFLKWFKDTFMGSKVYGIDIINPLILAGIKTFQIDQNNSQGLIDFGTSFGQFDIIIDDASHEAKATENTFNCLWQFVKPKGWYFIEDWGVCYSKDHFALGDMRDLFYRIMKEKEDLKIKEMEIIYQDTWTSIACFRKL